MRTRVAANRTFVPPLVGVAWLLLSNASLACSCRERTDAEQFNAAIYVAHVRVVSTELRSIEDLRRESPDLDEWKDNTPEYVRVSFQEVEVFKKSIAAPQYLRELPFGPGNCMVGLLAGMEYIVYLSQDSMSFVDICSGSFGFFNREGAEVAPKINELRRRAKSSE